VARSRTTPESGTACATDHGHEGTKLNDESHDGIAIIGMAGRFPGAETVEQLWSNLVAGKESISFFSDAQLAEGGLDAAALKSRGHYVPARGILKDAECFDAAFFGVHPKEADVIDPQQRLFLEICWTALERAGYAPSQMRGAVGVFGGATFNTYYLHALHHRSDLLELIGPELVMFGNEKDYLTTRVAYKLGLKGPAVNVSTACSTSLVAVTQAYQSLLTYQCDVALAGGVSITVPQQRGYFHDEGNIGSADGHTRTFDAQASGTAFSNGVAVVVLKRLAEAIADRDQIYAVVKGAALNNDGSHRVSFGAPGVEGQSEVIAMAHALAGVDPDTITYVEAHGTATPLGDPIEVAGLTRAFRLGTQATQFCALGSIKSNLGHLDAAAGVTGLIKVALSLHARRIPASLHFTRANPKLDLQNSPFYVNATLQEWKTRPGVPRRAGVSSFGTGGTNAHLVLEESPELTPSGPSRPWQLLMLSAKTPQSLDRATANLSEHLKQIEGSGDEAQRALADAAFTLQTGRSEFGYRCIAVCRDAADGAAALEARDPKRVFTHQQQLKEPPVVFMFPGQGAQYPGMGANLYRLEPLFHAEVDRCADVLRQVLETDLRTLMFPVEGTEKHAAKLLEQTQFTQPALFTIEYALAKLWIAWGIQPTAMIGHSVGEYVAGCLAGVFSVEEALTLVAQRGALVQTQPGGAMLAVRLPEEDVAAVLPPQISIAAINSPNLCVVAGPYDAMSALEEQLATQGVVTRRLHTSHAFHSSMMEPVLAPFTELLSKVSLGEPTIPYVSNVTAQWVTPAEARSPEYWAGHIRDTVRFSDGVAELMKDPRNILLEVGPGQTLSTLARQHPVKAAEQIVLASLQLTGAEESRGMLETLGRLWMAGVAVNWEGFYDGERRRRAVLPTYPFERKRYWPAPARAGSELPAPSILTPTPGTTRAAPALRTPGTVPGPPASGEPVVLRREQLRTGVRALLQELSGYDLSTVHPATELLELGLDSLLLTQAATLFQRKFGVPLTFRQLMEELSSIDAIASHLDAQLPSEVSSPAAVPPVPTAGPAVAGAPTAMLEHLLQQQQQLMNQLLALMGKPPVGTPCLPVAAAPPAQALAAPAPVWTAPTAEEKAHGPFRPMDRGAATALSPVQRRALAALIDRYTRRTGGSKEIAAANRPVLADPRSAAGFKQAWKEMVYPIVTTRSHGSKIWDVDGNEYVDFVMGFGASLFGHRPPFVVDAIREQLERGFEIGPVQSLAGEVAALVKEFTGMERVGFANTGSEAVLAATRVARTVTGRDKIAVFAGAYHGIFDEVLFRPVTRDGEPRAASIAPGIPEGALDQVIVLDYGNPQSLEYLRAHGSQIAAVLVEPVQSRRLDLQPKEFLHELRRITTETQSALIFDEVVTGFRVHPGGAQAYFGVRADLATYGKVIGGGLPIGVVTGRSKFMDALDGGQWQYGDASFPEVGVTFFAGTFVRHPLVLAAARAVLTHLKTKGPELQERLNARTRQLAGELQAILDEFRAPYHLTQFSSLIHVAPPGAHKHAGLLFYLLRERGIHIWDNRALVVTTAHSEEDLRTLTTAFRESLAEMQSGEFLSPRAEPSTEVPKLGPELRLQLHEPVAESAVPTAAFRLTEAQKEIWLAAQMGGDAAVAYNESLKLQFRGAFDVDLFRTATLRVVQRHPILRASLSEDGQWQRLNPSMTLEMPLLDFSAKSEAERDLELTAIIDREVSEPFDLVTGPLLRVRIVRMSAEYHVVMWTAHHIVCDGWSGGLIISELAKIYSALKQQQDPELEEPVPFRDYALATQNAGWDVGGSMAYWCERLANLPPPLELPTDRPRRQVRTARAFTFKRNIDLSVQQSIKRAAAQLRTTQVVFLLTTLKTLLHRLTGQVDLVVGLGAAGQAISGKHCMVGHCLNLLPIRTQLDPEASFQSNLAAVKKSVLDGYDHHQCTIGSILQYLKVPRTLSRSPLVEVLFNLDRDPSAAEFVGTDFVCERNPKHALHFDLSFNIVDSPRGLSVECDYNTDLFDESTIERWLGHYQTLLESVAVTPSEVLRKVPILRDSERREMIDTWNPTRVEISHEALPKLFERQAAKTPDAPAVTFAGVDMTYGELNRRANQLAGHLKENGVGPEVLVGLLVERSLDMVVALFGVLKAGGAYVPLDPSFPHNRLRDMIEDARIPLLVTHRDLDRALTVRPERVVRLDADWNDISAQSAAPLESTPRPEDLAYVLYTSGSTGRPKGVEIPHSALVNLLRSMQREPGFTATDTLLALTTLSFDIAGLEIYLPLVSGGRLVIANHEDAYDPARLMELMRGCHCTVVQATPATWQALVKFGWNGSSDLKILCGGESLPPDLAEKLRARSGELWNMYGPTETTIWSTLHKVTSVDGTIPIGRPIANTQVFVLDPDRRLVPQGAVGELYIGGSGLARGYLRRPELTKDRFVPSPFAPNERLYRTGDMARWLADGTLACLGRIDTQVKIRGFRVELGEVETLLGRHEGIRQCVVVAREDEPEDRRLVAYFEPASESVPAVSDLRAHLRIDLPDYMIPSAFVALETLPLTPNGKIDRTALPRPDEGRMEIESGFVAPRDSLELALAGIWSKVLKVPGVGIRDNFFELGGHSLSAVVLLTEIRKLTGRTLPLATLFQASTVAELADLVRQDGWTPSWSSLVPIQPAGSRRPLFLVHGAEGNVLLYRAVSHYLGTDQPVYGLQSQGLNGIAYVDTSVPEMASKYIQEAMTVQPKGPYILGGYCLGGVVALEMAQQLQSLGEEVELVLMLDTYNERLISPLKAQLLAPLHFIQNAWFHVANALSVPSAERRKFFRGKWDVGVIRLKTRLEAALHSVKRSAREGGHDYPHLKVKRINDKAAAQYAPRPYLGRVAVIRSKGHFVGLASPSLGWDGFVRGGLEVHELQVSPRGMLVDPFARSLAATMADCIKSVGLPGLFLSHMGQLAGFVQIPIS
jgi:amino acid adenylation domain-containing protein